MACPGLWTDFRQSLAPERIGGDGEHKIEKGQSLTLRYRFIFHKGPAKDAKIGQRFSLYAKDQGHPTSLAQTSRISRRLSFTKKEITYNLTAI